MNEHELKNALREAVVASSPPPPMDAGGALEAGRSAARKRRATWGGAVAGLAVVGIAVGATLVPGMSGGSGGGVQVAGQSSLPLTTGQSAPPSSAVHPPTVTTTTSPSGAPGGSTPGSGTKTSWPDGQQDRTARSGPRADKGAKVLNDLSSSLPPGFDTPDKQRVGYEDYGPMRHAQAQFEEYVGQTQVWEYWARTPVVKTGVGGVGRLEVQVLTKGATEFDGATGCAAALRATYPVRGGNGRCGTVDANGKQVTVLTVDSPDENTLEQGAFFWHEDGTLVIVAQSKAYANSGHPGMAEQPLTQQQLAALAADPKFHLD